MQKNSKTNMQQIPIAQCAVKRKSKKAMQAKHTKNHETEKMLKKTKAKTNNFPFFQKTTTTFVLFL